MTSATPARFCESATALLASRGVAGLTLSALCEETDVSTGSFYHHFGSWDGFVDHFLEDWEAQWTQRIVELAEDVADPMDRVAELERLAGALPHAAESSIRAWSYSNAAVALSQERVDARRLAYLHKLLGELVSDRRQVESLSVFVLAAYVGAELLYRRVPGGSVVAVLREATARVVAVIEQQPRAPSS